MEHDDQAARSRWEMPLSPAEEVCPNCGEAVRLQDLYCPSCNEVLSPPNDQDDDDVTRYRGQSDQARSFLVYVAGATVAVAVLVMLLAGLVWYLTQGWRG